MRRIWRICKWCALALLGTLAAVLLLNSFDEKPSPTANALLQPQGEDLPRQQNLYYPLMGFFSPAGVDMEEAGWKWVQAMIQARRDGRSMVEAEHAAEPARYQFIGDKSQLPGRQAPSDLPGLMDLIRKDEAVGMRLVNDNRVLLDRYLALRRYPHFAVTVPPNMMMVGMPAWEGVMIARGLWKLELAQLLLHDRANEVGERLEQDVAFWRSQIAEPRVGTLSKTLMNSILMSDYQIASQLLRVDGGQAQGSALRALSAPLTRPELSMDGPFRAEFAQESYYMFDVLQEQGDYKEIQKMAGSWRSQLQWRLERLFYLPQATVNIAADRMQELIDVDGQPCVRPRTNDAQARTYPFYTWLRNPIGKEMAGMPNPYGFYTRRMCQLTGFQRLLALQLELRRRGVPDAQIADFVRDAGPEFADPFTGGPMQWLPDQHALSFNASDQRGKETLPWPI